MSPKLQSLYGLKFNPFRPDVPVEALHTTPAVDAFLRRVELGIADGGYVMITGDPGTGKSVALRLLSKRLESMRDVVVGTVEHPQSRTMDFYRELGDLFGVPLHSHNRWAGFKTLRTRWAEHITSTLSRPVLIIDEAQETLTVIATRTPRCAAMGPVLGAPSARGGSSDRRRRSRVGPRDLERRELGFRLFGVEAATGKRAGVLLMPASSTPRLVLYGNSMWSSPYVLTCFVGLTEKQLPFEMRTVALHEGAQWEADYVATSFTARVPSLVDGDFSLSESSAIIEYLEDGWPSPGHAALLPRDSRLRARARQIMAWVRSDLGALREARSSEYVFYPLETLQPYAPLPPAARRAAEKLVGFAERVVPADGGPLFDAWCIADTDLAMMLQRLVKTNEALPARLRAFAEREWQRASVQAFVNHPRPPHHPALT